MTKCEWHEIDANRKYCFAEAHRLKPAPDVYANGRVVSVCEPHLTEIVRSTERRYTVSA
jgi:hypothetical protein